MDLLLAQVFAHASENPSPFLLLVKRHQEADVATMVEEVLETLRAHTLRAILHEDSSAHHLCSANAATAAQIVVGVFLAGLERVVAGEDPLIASNACAAFIAHGMRSVGSG